MTLPDLTAPIHRQRGERDGVTLVTDRVTTLASTADTGNTYALYEVETPPSGGCPPHTQRYDDATLVVLDGTYDVMLGDEPVRLAAGGYAFIPRGTLQAWANPEPTPARMLMLVTPGGIHAQFLDEAGDPPARAPWDVDMGKVLAVAPKYGIEFVRADLPGHAAD